MTTMRKFVPFAIALIILGALLCSCNRTAKETNKPPVISSFSPSFTGSSVGLDKVVQLKVNFTDPNVKGTINPADFTFKWTAQTLDPVIPGLDPSDNFLVDDDQTCYWRTPNVEGYFELIVEIKDRYEDSVIGRFTVNVSENSEPMIIDSFTLSFAGSTVGPDEVVNVKVNFSDPDIGGTPNPADFTFKWTARVIEPSNPGFDPNDNFLVDDEVTCYWRTPTLHGFYELAVLITDEFDDTAYASCKFEVTENKSPVISNIEISNSLPQVNKPITITVTADDPDGNLPLAYEWTASKGYFPREADNEVDWIGSTTGDVTITVKVSDSLGAFVEKNIFLSVQSNSDPIIDGYTVDNTQPTTGQEIHLTVTAHDPDGDELSYVFEATGGGYSVINGASATWVAPLTADNYTLTITVNDTNGGSDKVEIPVEVVAP
jgi:hypothetical protein